MIILVKIMERNLSLCHNWNEKYFGETRRSLEQRVKEQKRDVYNGIGIQLGWLINVRILIKEE